MSISASNASNVGIVFLSASVASLARNDFSAVPRTPDDSKLWSEDDLQS